MKISLNIILDILRPFQFESYIIGNHNFSSCLSLTDTMLKPNETCLYLGRLSEALLLHNKSLDFFCLCIRDRVKDNLESEQTIKNLIIINENVSLSTIMNLVQSRFFEVADWIQKMHETLIQGGNLQEIVDIGASFLNNNIAIVDSSFVLMAYSSSVPCDDPVCVALAEYGYHPEESIQKFKKNKLFALWQKEDLIFDDTLETESYPTLNKIFRFSGTYFAHVVMTYNRNAPTKGLNDLFLLFVDIIAPYIERGWATNSSSGRVYDQLLIDLIEGNISSKSVIEKRARSVNMPINGTFCLFQITSNDTANMSIGKMLVEFSELFPGFYFIRYKQKIVAINQFQARDDLEGQLQTIITILENFLQKYDAICGVSLMFSNIEELNFAFYQSAIPLSYIKRINGRNFLKKIRIFNSTESRILLFKDYYLFCLLGENEGNAELWFRSEYHQMFERIYEHDCRQNVNSLQILYIYLNEERSATVAGNILNMHRNNILYHISRIENMLGIDFRNSKTRFMMQLSFVLLELYGLKKP